MPKEIVSQTRKLAKIFVSGLAKLKIRLLFWHCEIKQENFNEVYSMLQSHLMSMLLNNKAVYLATLFLGQEKNLHPEITGSFFSRIFPAKTDILQ